MTFPPQTVILSNVSTTYIYIYITTKLDTSGDILPQHPERIQLWKGH